jgi:cytochrome c peroxidase
LPTQDGVGKALATYLRTLLSGNSLHDRVMHGKKGALAVSDYEALLDDRALKALGRPTAVKAVVASDLLRGWTLFTGKAGCTGCHPANNGHFSDNQFHNIGAADMDLDEPGAQLGRFAVAPPGERNRYLRGAFRTPTLRNLSRTAPYFHNGRTSDLGEAVRLHVRKQAPGAPINLYLDPKLSDADGVRRDFGLGDEDIASLATFLKALDGDEVDRFVAINPN